VRVTLKLTYEVAVVTASFRRLTKVYSPIEQLYFVVMLCRTLKSFNLLVSLVDGMPQSIVLDQEYLLAFYFTASVMDQSGITLMPILTFNPQSGHSHL
jgi:hypothetical protein